MTQTPPAFRPGAQWICALALLVLLGAGAARAQELEIFSGALLSETPAVAFDIKNESFLVVGHSDGRLTARRVGNRTGDNPWMKPALLVSDEQAVAYALDHNPKKRKFLVAWSTGEEVRAVRLNRRGKRRGRIVTLYSLPRGSGATIDQVDVTAIVGTKQWLVTWLENNRLSFQFIKGNGKPKGRPREAVEDVWRYAIGYSPTSEQLLVAWSTSFGEAGIFGQFFSRDGTAEGSAIKMVGGEENDYPALEFNAQRNRWLVLWSSQWYVEGLMIDNGTLTDYFWCYMNGERGGSAGASFCPDGREYLVSWTPTAGDGEPNRVYAQWVRENGTLQGEQIVVKRGGEPKDNDTEEFVSCSTERPICLVTWWEGTEQAATIRGRFLVAPELPPAEFWVEIELGQDDPYPDEVLELYVDGEYQCRSPIGGGCFAGLTLQEGRHTLGVKLISDTGASGGSNTGTPYYVYLWVSGEATVSPSEIRKTVTGIGTVQETRFNVIAN